MGNLNTKQFGEYTLTHSLMNGHHSIDISNDEWSNLGSLEWNHKTGVINSLVVNDDHQRKGLATAMFNFANELSAKRKSVTKPKHDLKKNRTSEGNAWVESLKKAKKK